MDTKSFLEMLAILAVLLGSLSTIGIVAIVALRSPRQPHAAQPNTCYFHGYDCLDVHADHARQLHSLRSELASHTHNLDTVEIERPAASRLWTLIGAVAAMTLVLIMDASNHASGVNTIRDFFLALAFGAFVGAGLSWLLRRAPQSTPLTPATPAVPADSATDAQILIEEQS